MNEDRTRVVGHVMVGTLLLCALLWSGIALFEYARFNANDAGFLSVLIAVEDSPLLVLRVLFVGTVLVGGFAVWRVVLRLAQLEGAARDAAERGSAGALLWSSEGAYHEIFDASSDAIIVHDAKTGALMDVNRTMCEKFGYTREEALKLSVGDISLGAPPYSQVESQRWIRKAIEEGPQIFEWVCKKKSGERFWVEISLRRARIDGQERIIAIDRDITERERADTRSLKSERNLAAAQKLAHVGSWDWDVRTGEVEWSDEVYRIFGLTPERFQPQIDSVMSRFHPEDRTKHEQLIKHAMANKELHSFDARILLPDNTVRHVVSTAQGQYNSAGRLARIIGTVHDISERKRTEDALRETGARLEALINSSPVAIVQLDRRGRVTLWSPAAQAMFGWSEAEVRGRLNPIVPPESQAEFKTSMERILRGESVSNVPCRRQRKDGSAIDIDLSAAPLRDAEGRIVGLVGAMTDVSERKRSEQALAASEARYRILFESAGDGIFLAIDGVFHDCNQKALEMFGCGRKDIIGRSPAEFSPIFQPDGRASAELVREKIDAAFRGSPMRFEWQHKRLDGTLFDTEVNLNLVELSTGPCILAIVRDITERKRAEEALRKSRAILNDTGTIARIGGWEHDLNTGKAVWTDALYEIIGIELGQPVPGAEEHLSYYPPEDRARLAEAYQRSIKTGEPFDLELRCHTVDGRLFWSRAIGRPVFAGGKCVKMQGTFQDITERKRAEEERQQLEIQLHQAQKLEAIGQLAGGVAHDFNNILTAILSHVELSLDSARAELGFEHSLVGSMEQIEGAAQRASALTRQLLAFSRRDVIRPQAVNLNEVLADLDKMLRRLITEDVVLDVVAAPRLPSVEADTGQLEQVIVNLVVNAVHAMPDGGRLTLETSTVTLEKDYAQSHAEARLGPHVLLAISDTGSGMDAATLERIFEPFFTTKAMGKGTGLGLATVHGIVKRSGGHIMVYSEPGLGTMFKVYLPVTEAAPVDRAPNSEPDAMQHDHATILLCEDDDPVRGLIAQLLGSVGYTVITASSGRAGLAAAQEHAGGIDLLLTDVIMPDMNGRALAERLQDTRPGLATLFISGYTSNVIAHHGVLDDGVEFLEKPFTREALLEKVRTVLGKARLEA